jgi:uncharacterized protein with PIN domain
MYFNHILNAQAVGLISAVGKVETLMVVLSRAQNEGRERFDFMLEKLGVEIIIGKREFAMIAAFVICA